MQEVEQLRYHHALMRKHVALLVCIAAASACGGSEKAEPPVATPSLTLNHTRVPIGSPLKLTYSFQVADNASFDGDYVVFVHVLKNIMIPIVTVLGLELGSQIAFSVVTETVFAWPGMGKLLIDSIINLDRPVVVAYLLLIVFFLVMLNLVVDIIYTVLDPRVRLDSRR